MNSLNYSVAYPVPEPQAGQILVEMKASSVNPIDYKILDDVLHDAFPIHFPSVMGMEGAGVVTAVASDTSGRIKVGDEVWFDGGIDNLGSYADYMAIPEQIVSVKPASLSFEEAATVPLVGMTSMQAMMKINANTNLKGKSVLILGGSGGTGSIAIQIAKHVLGAARVITTCSAGNFDFVKSLGADEAIDYHVDNWWEVIEQGTIDGVYDTVGQAGTAPNATKLLAWDGVFLTIAHKGPAVGLDPNPKPATVQIYHKLNIMSNDLDMLRNWFDTGKLKPTVSKVYHLEDLEDAWSESAAGHVVGKLAVTNSQGNEVV